MPEGGTATPDGEREERLRDATAAIWERFQDQVFQRVTVIEKAALAFLENDVDPELRREAEREAHRLAGAVGTFGFHEASRLARRAEQVLTGNDPLPENAVHLLTELAVQLRATLQAGATQHNDIPSPQPEHRVWLIGPPGEFFDALAMEAGARGFDTDRFATPREAAGVIDGQAPDAMVLDLSSVSHVEGAVAGVASLSPAPLIVIDEHDRFSVRVEAARAGVAAFLTLPSTAASVVDVLTGITSVGLSGARILAVDDDPIVLDFLQQKLSEEGAEVTTLADPQRFWRKLIAADPDLIILDLDLPEVGGLDLCRVLRADPRWNPVPIVMMTANRNSDTLSQVLEAGGDDYIPKPVAATGLIRRISLRLARNRHLRRLAGVDTLTRVFSRTHFAEQAERLLHLGTRYDKEISFLLLSLDHLREINTTRGSATGDEVLRGVARRLETCILPGDAIGRWDGDAFMLAMYGTSGSSAAERIRNVLGSLGQAGVRTATSGQVPITLSVGIASFPTDGETFDTLARAAESALNVARSEGRNRVSHYGSRVEHGDGVKNVDVLLVEDDPIIARLLSQTLESNRYSYHWINDGRQAVASLTGDTPSISARLVLLDVDLPGLDGFGVLRAIREKPALRDTRVIMLTVRANEAEVVRSLGAGAFDHVAKPFSIPVLMQRVQRALTG